MSAKDIALEDEKSAQGLAAKLRRANDLGLTGDRFYKVDANRFDEVVQALDASDLIPQPYTLAIIDQGPEKPEYQWCIVACDKNGEQIPQIQGYDWRERPIKTRKGVRAIWLERPKPTQEKANTT